VTTAPDRHARRREATRAKLAEAAKALFARQGIDNPPKLARSRACRSISSLTKWR
jgi:hypothetical protein